LCESNAIHCILRLLAVFAASVTDSVLHCRQRRRAFITSQTLFRHQHARDRVCVPRLLTETFTARVDGTSRIRELNKGNHEIRHVVSATP